MSHHVAVDLGASSGRVFLGEVGEDALTVREVHRFANRPLALPDGLHWNLTGQFDEVLNALVDLRRSSEHPLTIGVDSWGVDYGLVDASGRLLGLPFHYRDERTAGQADRVHEQIPPDELYACTGVQHLPFNTIYQLAAEPPAGAVALAADLLMVPDLLTYWLTGVRGGEVTNASTTGLLDVRRRAWSEDLITRLRFDRALFPTLVEPGTTVGAVRAELLPPGTPPVTAVRVASHDTASAVAGVPATGDGWAYISCGTWSVVGVERTGPITTPASRAANLSNELGVDGTVRYLRNVMGLWLLQESLRQWTAEGRGVGLADVLRAAGARGDGGPVIDPDDPLLLPPGDMPSRIRELCERSGQRPPADAASAVRCILDSLAAKLAATLDEAETLSGQAIEVVHMVGGGAENALLCQLTADAAGRRVVAGPTEAAAVGNLLVQARAAGTISGDLARLRQLVAASFELRTYMPRAGRARR